MEHGVRECRKLLEALNRNGENIFHQKLGPKRLKDVLELKKSKGDRHVTMKDLIGIRGISSKTLGNMTSSSTHVTRIIETCQYYESIYGEVKTVPPTVVSIDLGISQVAIGHVSADMRILEWERVLLESPRPYTPKAGYELVSRLFDNLPESDVYLLEVQSHRTSTKWNSGFMDVSLRLRLLESLLYAVGLERGSFVYSISPTKVARYFDLPRGAYYRKKQAATSLVSHLIGVPGFEKQTTPLGSNVSVSESLKEYFQHEKKSDDLSDCILQAIAFIEWSILHKTLW